MALVWSLNVHPKSSSPIINPNYTISTKFPVDRRTRRSLPRFRSFLTIRNCADLYLWFIVTCSIFILKRSRSRCLCLPIVSELGNESDQSKTQGDNNEDLGVKAALSVLKFYKSEISPLLPKSCRYVPTCSEYSMISYKKYGFVRGSILTAWRICRCNPFGNYIIVKPFGHLGLKTLHGKTLETKAPIGNVLFTHTHIMGGSGFDPPRWFDEPSPPEQ